MLVLFFILDGYPTFNARCGRDICDFLILFAKLRGYLRFLEVICEILKLFAIFQQIFANTQKSPSFSNKTTCPHQKKKLPPAY